MRRTTVALLLLAATLPMAAEEAATVTVHQTEWGDSQVEAPPPSGPAVPVKASAPVLVFESRGFRYGEGLRYSSRNDYGQAFRYQPNTRLNGSWRQSSSQYRLDQRYQGTGERMRNSYQPNIKYAPGINRSGGSAYGFSR